MMLSIKTAPLLPLTSVGSVSDLCDLLAEPQLFADQEDLTVVILEICPFQPTCLTQGIVRQIDYILLFNVIILKKKKKLNMTLPLLCAFFVCYVKHMATVRYTAVVCMLRS